MEAGNTDMYVCIMYYLDFNTYVRTCASQYVLYFSSNLTFFLFNYRFIEEIGHLSRVIFLPLGFKNLQKLKSSAFPVEFQSKFLNNCWRNPFSSAKCRSEIYHQLHILILFDSFNFSGWNFADKAYFFKNLYRNSVGILLEKQLNSA